MRFLTQAAVVASAVASYPVATVTTNTFEVTGLSGGPCVGIGGTAALTVKDASNVFVTSSVTGTFDTNKCVIDVSGLADGTYTFNDGTDRTVTIQRVFATVFAGEVSREIILPGDLFPTAPVNGWTVLSATMTGTGSGFSLVAGKVGVAKLFADAVDTTSSTWTVTATDGAATPTLVVGTFNVLVRGDSNAAYAVAAKPLLTLQDSRAEAGAQRFSAAGNFYSAGAAVTVKVTFSEPHTASATTRATLGGAAIATLPTSSNGGRTFTYTLTGVAHDALFDVPAGTFTRTVKNAAVASAALGPIAIKLQANSAFGAAAASGATLTAAADKDYFYYIPASLFTNLNSAGSVDILSATSSQMGAGLRLLPGKLGRAAIQGKVLTANVPAAHSLTGCYGGVDRTQVVFAIKARDASGKEVTSNLCVAVETSGDAGSITAFNGGKLDADEGVAVAIDGAATSTFTTATKVIAYLETPDSSADETINGLDAAWTAVEASMSAPLFMAAKTGITAGNAQAELRALQYVNTYEDAVGTDAVNKRAVRLVVAKGSSLPGATDGMVLGVATRPINYKVENDPPTLSVITAKTFAEGAASTTLFPGITVGDADDTVYRQATVTISNNCDVNDRLALSAASTTVGSFWNAAKCQLTLVPAPGAATIADSDMENALASVVYMTNKPTEPTAGQVSGNTGKAVRTITLAVTDDASKKHVAAPKTNVATTTTLTVTSTKSAPQFKPAAAYGAGGIFASADPNANVATVAGVPMRKPVLINKAGAAQTFTFNFNKVKDSVYAGGALVFTDSKNTYITAPGDITVGTIVASTGAMGTVTASVVSSATGTSPELYQLTITPADGDTVGEFTIPLMYTDPAAPNAETVMNFVIDVRKPACHLGQYTPATQYPDPAMCTTPATLSYTGTAGNLVQGTVASQRGAYTLAVPANSIASTSSVTLNGNPVSAVQMGQLPNFSTPGSSVDFGTAVTFGPAGTQFTTPATVCVNAGVIPPGFKGVLAVSSQIDANDETKGYTNWELLGNQATTAVTNSDKICGDLDHFSVVAVVLVPNSANPSAQKAFQMGASCPSGCSGKGFCRENGQCVCFDGFTGYDCAQRTCPADESWDVPADGSVAHKAAECSSRGACDRKTGTCACYPGFEGAACQRVACPNDCSGHGKCRALSDAATGSIVDHRIQMCQCDAGYTGNDCSQRVCAFGDDPETACSDNNRQKQRVTVDFGTLPAGVDGNSDAFTNLYDNDELTLAFTTKDGHKFFAPKVANFWATTASSSNSGLAAALKKLPSFAVSDVEVSSTVSSNYAKVDLDVEFSGSSLAFSYNGAAMANGNALYQAAGAVAGITVSGGQNLLSCDNLAGLDFMGGCYGQGCDHAHKQPRLYEADVLSGASFASLNTDAVLLQPAAHPTVAAANFDAPGVWGVQVLVTVTSDGTANGATYKYDTTVYGEAVTSSDEMPVPPTDLRTNVPIAYGLHLNFEPGIIPAGVNQMLFSWRLPKCTVTEVQAASAEFEVFECSNRGVCDRKSGQCQCFNGYSGYNCGQQTVVL